MEHFDTVFLTFSYFRCKTFRKLFSRVVLLSEKQRESCTPVCSSGSETLCQGKPSHQHKSQTLDNKGQTESAVAFFFFLYGRLGISEVSSLKVYAQGISNSSFANPVTRRSPHHQNVRIKARDHTNFQSVGFGVRTNFDDSKILNIEKCFKTIA